MSYSSMRSSRESGDQQKSTAMPHVSRGVYLVLQRILKNVWFGEASPVQEAIQHIRYEQQEHVEILEVERVLAEYINLLMRRIPSLQNLDVMNTIVSWQQRQILDTITKYDARLVDLRNAEYLLVADVQSKERTVRDLRKRHKYLADQEASLKRRIADLERREHEVQQELARVGAMSLVEIDKCIEYAKLLAEGGIVYEEKTEQAPQALLTGQEFEEFLQGIDDDRWLR